MPCPGECEGYNPCLVQDMEGEAVEPTSAAKQRKFNNKFGGISIPLVDGKALALVYFEWLVGSGAAPSSMHDEFVQLLVDSIAACKEKIGESANVNNTKLLEKDSLDVLILKVLSRKLRYFLQLSEKCNLQRVTKMLPTDFLHERALIKAKTGLLKRH